MAKYQMTWMGMKGRAAAKYKGVRAEDDLVDGFGK